MDCDLEKIEVPVLQIYTQVLENPWHNFGLHTDCSNYMNSFYWNIISETVHKQYTVIG